MLNTEFPQEGAGHIGINRSTLNDIEEENNGRPQ